jgi:light-regulated signal transduction histidine kinase (bacteriophytochrome)
MTDNLTPSALHLKENRRGRIDNLAMSPSYANTLIPVFQALMNSIHSMQERFGDEWIEKAKIRLEIENDDENPHSFAITDNGVGLNDANFDSFRTLFRQIHGKQPFANDPHRLGL